MPTRRHHRIPPVHVRIFLALALLSGLVPAFGESPTLTAADLSGKWTLTNTTSPKEPSQIDLHPDGSATEHLGEYRGVGTWTFANGTATILWANGKIAVLQASPAGGFELLTWKQNSPRDKAPDFVQPAARAEKP